MIVGQIQIMSMIRVFYVKQEKLVFNHNLLSYVLTYLKIMYFGFWTWMKEIIKNK